jgi:succinate dehydrogenase/fumarate reductase flavoprotein subunit
MWERVGILRDADSLKTALAGIRADFAGNLSVSSRKFRDVGENCCRRALGAKNRAAGHFRNDFPERDENGAFIDSK